MKGNYLTTYESLLNLNSFASSGQMVGVTDPGSSGPGSSPSRSHCVVFLCRTLNSPSASLFRAEKRSKHARGLIVRQAPSLKKMAGFSSIV